MRHKRILRIFPHRTKCTPDDDLTDIGSPGLGLFVPEVDEVHISVTFSWDIECAYKLQEVWSRHYPKVRIGGPAMGTVPGKGFVPGQYVTPGVTFTSRGCPNRCSWCIVHDLEGPFRQIKIKKGNVIQDNNILAADKTHFRNVCKMLNTCSRGAKFAGGFESDRLRAWHIDALKGLRSILEVYLACDIASALPAVKKAAARLSWLGRKKIRCYALCGYAPHETVEDAEQRLEAIWEAGCLPFVQMYQPPDRKIVYGPEWRKFVKRWSRPAIMYARHEKVWTHIYRWGNNPKRKTLQGRKCRVISKGSMKSCLVEFYGGERVVVSVRSLRKRSELEIRGDKS